MSIKGILFDKHLRVKQIKPLYKLKTLVYLNCLLKLNSSWLIPNKFDDLFA